MRRSTRMAAVVSVALALAVSGCAKKDTTTTMTSSSGSSCVQPSADKVVGMAYDVGGRGDQSFNDSAAAGMDKAACEFGFTTKESEAQDGEPESAREERLRTFADAGIDPIIAVGFAYAPAVAKVAKEYPNLHFALIDSTDATGPNIANLVFAEQEGSFLVGVAAALKSQTHHVGFIGGVDTPLLNKFEAGYVAGAKAADPSIKIDVQYLSQPPDFSGFGDPAKGKTTAQGMYDGGADIVYAAAGGSGAGVFEAAQAAGTKAIGVDADQYLTADPSVKDVILTSMVKHVDVAVYDYLKQVNDGTFPTGTRTYDLKDGGVAYATSGGFVDDIKSKLDAYKQQITDGKITVPTKP